MKRELTCLAITTAFVAGGTMIGAPAHAEIVEPYDVHATGVLDDLPLVDGFGGEVLSGFIDGIGGLLDGVLDGGLWGGDEQG